VTLITGPTKLPPPADVEVIAVRSTAEMYRAVMSRVAAASVFIGCAAVCDFRPTERAAQKIKKQGRARLTLELEATEDIIAAVGGAVGNAAHRPGRIVVGFAAESEALLPSAEQKLREKGLDLIVANDIARGDAGFDVETNAATILKRDGSQIELPLQSKRALADRLLDEIGRLRQTGNLEAGDVATHKE